MTKKGRLSIKVLGAYSAIAIPEQVMIGPVFGILPALYAQGTTATLAEIGAIFMIARLFDAIIDPLIGLLSDQTVSRYGARKPWIAVGSVVCAVSVVFFFMPTPDAGAMYFLIWCSALFLGWTMVTIPYNAWATELTGDYQERSRLFAVRNTVAGLGGLLFILSPILLQPWTGKTEFSLEVMRILGIFVAVALPVAVLIALRYAPQGANLSSVRPSLKGLGQSLRKNRILWLFISIATVGSLTAGVTTALQFLFLTSYLNQGANVSAFGGAQMLAGLASIPVWLWITRWFGKHRPWAFSRFAVAIAAIGLLFLPPGPESFYPLLYLSILVGALNGIDAISPFSILADIVDYDTLKTGANRAGNYFSFLALLSKANAAIGSGLGLTLVGLLGYNAQGANAAGAVTALLVMVAVVPSALYVLQTVLILRYPLNERRQTIIRRRIEQNAARAAARAQTAAVPVGDAPLAAAPAT